MANSELQKLILVVDDEPNLIDVMVFELEEAGYRTLKARSGNEAVKILKTKKVDAIVSDIRMPDGSGLDLLDFVRTRSTERPVVIFVSAYADFRIEDVYDRGADAMFSKPFCCDSLISTLRRLLQNETSCWQAEPTSTLVEQAHVLSLEFNEHGFLSSTIRLGRGGFFAELPKNQIPEVGSMVQFVSTAGTPGTEVTIGVGTVRWTRLEKTSDCSIGAGIEILNFVEPYRKMVKQTISMTSPKAFIPKM